MGDTPNAPLALLGRVMLSAIFVMGGWAKLMAMGPTIAYISSHNMPVPELSYYASVAIELGGGILVLVGFQARLIGLLMALFCVVTAIIFHYVPDDRNMMTHFMKNICMAGGFLMLAAAGAGAWSVDAMFGGRARMVRPA